MIFRGMDPNARLTGRQAWGNIEGVTGRTLGNEFKVPAMGLIGYGDLSGESEISGKNWDTLAQEAVKLFGGTFEPWQPEPQAIAQTTPSTTPAPQAAPAPDFSGTMPADWTFEGNRGPGNPSDADVWDFLQRNRNPDGSYDINRVDEAFGNIPGQAVSNEGYPIAPEWSPFTTSAAVQGSTMRPFTLPTPPKTPDPFAYQAFDPGDPFAYKPFDPSDPFAYQDFVAPDANSMTLDPSYQFRLKQGQDMIENAHAGQGTLRMGSTLKELNDYAQQAAAQEYAALYNRALDTHRTGYAEAKDEYDTNRQNRFDEYLAGYDIAKGTYDTNRNNRFDEYRTGYDIAADTYDRNLDTGFGFYDRAVDAEVLADRAARDDREFDYEKARDERNFLYGKEIDERNFLYGRDVDTRNFEFQRETWQDDREYRNRALEVGERQADREFAQREREFTSNDQFRRAVQGDEMSYRRYRDTIDDAWKLKVLEEQRLQFLAELGTR